MNVNKAIIVGRLTRDPEVRATASGQNVTSLSMATNHTWTDKSVQKQEKSEFHNVVLWGRLAEIAGQYLTKGQECYIEGRIQSRTYTDKAGVERKATEIVAENMQLGSRPQGQGGGYAPRQNATPRAAAATGAGAAAGASLPREEEIPTINLDDEKEDIRIEDVPF
jgi:single-strand DNA-binding protein